MSQMVLIVLLGFLIVLLGIISYLVVIYNGLIVVKNNVKKSWSNIDVLLKQRFDELPNLVSVCERYMRHEAETLEKVTKARAMMSNASSSNQVKKADNMISDALKSLFAVTENYPDLKADKNFNQLQKRVTELENEISDRRELYNETVNIYNIRIENIPDVFVANILNYRVKPLWQIDAKERKNKKIQFAS